MTLSSVSNKSWIFKEYNDQDVLFFKENFSLDEITSKLLSIRKIKKELRWSHKISIEHGVNNLLKNLQDWKKAPIWTPEKIKKETKMWFKFLT